MSKKDLLARLCGLILWRGTQVCPHDRGILLFAPYGACPLCGLDGREVNLSKTRACSCCGVLRKDLDAGAKHDHGCMNTEAEVEQVAQKMEAQVQQAPCDFWGPRGCSFPTHEHTRGARQCRCGRLAPGKHYT